jgi:hypothetical protein
MVNRCWSRKAALRAPRHGSARSTGASFGSGQRRLGPDRPAAPPRLHDRPHGARRGRAPKTSSPRLAPQPSACVRAAGRPDSPARPRAQKVFQAWSADATRPVLLVDPLCSAARLRGAPPVRPLEGWDPASGGGARGRQAPYPLRASRARIPSRSALAHAAVVTLPTVAPRAGRGREPVRPSTTRHPPRAGPARQLRAEGRRRA